MVMHLTPALAARVQASAAGRLVGTCHRCGACCTGTTEDGAAWACEYLDRLGTVGTPEAARCAVYRRRYDGMPVLLRVMDGRTVASQCSRDSAAEAQIIRERGLGRGCALRPAGGDDGPGQ